MPVIPISSAFKSLMENMTKYTYALTIRIGSDTLGTGSVWSAEVSFCATAPMMDLRLFEAASANELMAFPTTEVPMDFSRRVGIARIPASEKIVQASTDISLTPGMAEIS